MVKYSIKHWTEQRINSSDLVRCDAVQGVLPVTWQVQLYISGVVPLRGISTMIWEVEKVLYASCWQVKYSSEIYCILCYTERKIRLQCSLQVKCTIFLEVVGCGTILLFLTVRLAITPTLGWVSSFSFKMNSYIVPLLFFKSLPRRNFVNQVFEVHSWWRSLLSI